MLPEKNLGVVVFVVVFGIHAADGRVNGDNESCLMVDVVVDDDESGVEEVEEDKELFVDLFNLCNKSSNEAVVGLMVVVVVDVVEEVDVRVDGTPVMLL